MSGNKSTGLIIALVVGVVLLLSCVLCIGTAAVFFMLPVEFNESFEPPPVIEREENHSP